MELKKKSWRNISINDYFRIRDIIEDSSLEDYDKEVELTALMCGCSEEEVWALPVDEFKKIQSSTLWLSNAELKPLDKVKYSSIVINGSKYSIDTDLHKFTVAQYVDFQAFWSKKDDKAHIGNLLACFIIPKGKEYADGYDTQALANDICSFLDIQTAYEIIGFFLVCWLRSTKTSLNCLSAKMKRNKKKMTEEQWSQHSKELETLEKSILDGFQLLT